MTDVFLFAKLKAFSETVYRGVFWYVQRWLGPLSLAEDDRRRESILNIFLFCSLVLNSVLAVIVLLDSFLQGHQYRGVAVVPFVIFLSIYSVLLAFSRWGHYRTASVLLLAFYFCGTTYSMVHWGPDLPVVLITYALIIVMSSVLIGTRFGFAVAGVVVLAILTVGVLQEYSIIPVVAQWRQAQFRVFHDGLIYALLLFLIGVVSWLANRSTEASLKRARLSEALLKEERDLLELKVEQRTEALRQLQLEEMSRLHRFAEFGRLATGLFHDLMTPLTALAFHVHNLEAADPKEASLAKTAITRAIADTRRMETMLGALRRQISQAPSVSEYDMVQEIHYVLQLFRHKALASDITLRAATPEQCLWVGDPLSFHHVVTNLVANAIDAYDGFMAATRREVMVTLTVDDSAIVVTCRDFGCGISSENLPYIFKPFYTTKQDTNGSGIGLSRTQHVVATDFHGTVTVISDPATGTCFTVTIPR